jgi:hypothetical protein
MKWRTEMQLRGSGLLDDRRFDALADALAELDEADGTVEDTDLTGSLADGWVLVAMVVTANDPADAIRKTVVTVRAAIQKIGDATPGWEQITDLAPLAVRPADSEPIHA